MTTLTTDQIAEAEHRVALHFEDAYDAALRVAEAELMTGAQGPRLAGDDDGCELPARGYTFVACRHGEPAISIAVAPAGGGAFVATVAARYTHVAAALGEAPDDDGYHPDAAAALAAALAASERHRSTVFEVYALAGGDRTALVVDGEVYRRP